MLRIIAIIYGMIFLSFGILGFVPSLTPNHLLFNLFAVNCTVNTLHLLTGVLAIWAGLQKASFSKIFFQLAGFVYAMITVLGFACGDTYVLGILATNMPDTWANLLIAILSIYFGFCIKINAYKKK